MPTMTLPCLYTTVDSFFVHQLKPAIVLFRDWYSGCLAAAATVLGNWGKSGYLANVDKEDALSKTIFRHNLQPSMVSVDAKTALRYQLCQVDQTSWEISG